MSEANREKEIFEQALDIESPEARAVFIRRECGGDETLIQRIHALLKASETAPEFLPENHGRSAGGIPGGTALEGPGTVIGRYKLLEQIGEGGFGYVYMAEQLEPVKRRVALKIIKPGMDSKQVIGRFEAERQALALMDHPNIAQIYDAGTTDPHPQPLSHPMGESGQRPGEGSATRHSSPATHYGRPYFVMELVKGIPITKFCAEQQLDLEARLNLFIQVCSAVQHAHQKGIIHRDLKPSNILVTLHGDQPVPKVIDFGIAKATQQPLTDKTIFTQFQQFLGTPAYMSPEQATLSGLDVDTRSDIYSLGVLLYELLTGSPPFDSKQLLSAGLDEMRRIIREKEPERPSTRIRRTSASSSQPQLETRHSPLPTDLDWIVMKCLEKERTRRYETAYGLAMDLKRHLNNEPVLARPPSRLYEFQKTVRRHWVGFTATAAVILVLAAGVLMCTLATIRARQAQQRAAVNFLMARKAVDEITQVADKQLANIPGVDKVRREMLRKAMVFYDGFAAGNKNDPAAKAEIAQAYGRVGAINGILGNFTQERKAYGRAIPLLEQLTAKFPSVPAYRVELADYWGEYAYSFLWAHGVQEEVQARSKALELWEGLVADFPTEPKYRQRLAEAYTDLGVALREARQLKEAETQLRQALAIWEKLGAEFPERPKNLVGLAHSHWWLGALLSDLGQLTEAEHELRIALELYEKQLAETPDRPELRGLAAHNRWYIAGVLMKQGHTEAAEQEYRQIVATREKLVAEYPDVFEFRRMLGHELRGLSEALMANGCPKEAENKLRQAIAIQEKIATGSPEMVDFQHALAGSLAELGRILSKTGRLEDAVAAYRRSARITESLPANFLEMPNIRKGQARVYRDCGHALKALGRSDEARQAYEHAKSIEADLPSR